jgi:hypothetical protein
MLSGEPRREIRGRTVPADSRRPLMTMTLAKADVGDTGGPPWADPALARFGPTSKG